MKNSIIAALTISLMAAGSAWAGETPSKPGTEVYFVNLADGATVKGPVKVVFGLSGMGVAPAGMEKKAPAITTCLLTERRSLKAKMALKKWISIFQPMITTYILAVVKRKHLSS